jgi:hypothetical protein
MNESGKNILKDLASYLINNSLFLPLRFALKAAAQSRLLDGSNSFKP